MNTQAELLHEAHAKRGLWDTLRHMMRMHRLMQTQRAVEQCLADLERVRTDLARALHARDRARADFTAHEFPMRDTDRPVLRVLSKKA